MIELILPYPPSLNSIWRHGSGKVFLSPQAKRYYNYVYLIYAQAKAPKFDVGARLELWGTAYPPDKRRRDIDNLPKVVFDSLEATGMFQNDAQIKKMHMFMMEPVDKKKSRIEIRIEKIPE